MQARPLASLGTSKISTGDQALDFVLGGGLPCGSLTEVTGEAAASKTQLCLQLLLAVQLPQEYGGLSGSAVYVHTEGAPAMQRLHQLAQCLPLRYPPEALAALPDPAANVFVEKGISSGVELLLRLQRLRSLLERQRHLSQQHHQPQQYRAAGSNSSGSGRAIRLIVVDSVAHVFRDLGEGGAGSGGAGVAELTGRTQLLFQISALLRRYADDFKLAVLLVNQVVDSVDSSTADGNRSGLQQRQQQAGRLAAAKNTGHTGGLRLMSMGREVVPALGLAWANCINTRIFLSRCLAPHGGDPELYHGPPSHAAAAVAAAMQGGNGSSTNGGGGALAPALRKLQVVFAPHLAGGRECFYIVETAGLRGLHPEELRQHDAAAASAAAAAAVEQWQQKQAWEREQRETWHQQQQQQQQQWQQPPWQQEAALAQQQQQWQQNYQSNGREFNQHPPYQAQQQWQQPPQRQQQQMLRQPRAWQQPPMRQPLQQIPTGW